MTTSERTDFLATMILAIALFSVGVVIGLKLDRILLASLKQSECRPATLERTKPVTRFQAVSYRNGNVN